MKSISRKKLIIVGLAAIAVLVLVGTVGALNGWFGGGAAIPSDTMTRGLVGYWNFDEGSGQKAFDASGNGNNGTLASSTEITSADPKWGAGKSGGGLQFDGVDDYVGVDGSNFHTLLTGTITLWVKGYGGLVGGWSNQSNNRQFYWYFNNNGKIRLDAIDENGNTLFGTMTTVNSFPSNEWIHIVYTSVDGSGSFTIYVNGVAQAVTFSSGSMTDFFIGDTMISTDDLQIGALSDITSQHKGFFNGAIDEVRIYNRALTPEEIRYHYNRGGPVAEWKFNEGSGQTAYDSTDNNNDGTLGASAASGADDPQWVSGKNGSGLQFDGVDDYVDAGNGASLQMTNSVTVGAWVKWTSGTANERVVRRGTTANSGFSLYSPTGNELTFVINNKYGNSAIIPLGEWTYIVGTYDHQNIRAYLNGKEIGVPQAYSSDIAAVGSTVFIGKHESSPSLNFSGLIDDVRVYNYARTADEIRLDYNAGFAAKFGPSTDCNSDPGSCMTKGLVGYWSMDEGAGQKAFDASGNGNNGTLGSSASADTNDPKWTTPDISGSTAGVKPPSGGALQFDGVDDYVSGNLVSGGLGTGNFTIGYWVRYPSFHNYITVLSTTRSATGFNVGTQASAQLVWYCEGEILRGTGTNFLANTWHYTTYVRNGTTLKGYVDGVEKASATDTHNYSQTSLNIGSLDGSSEWFNGSIDEVRIYNRALTPEEIRYHYNRGGPVAEWKFNEGSGQTAYDSTDNNNDGTLGASAASGADDPQWVSGKNGSALQFDGVNDSVSVTNGQNLNITGAITLEAWVKDNDITQDSPIVFKKDAFAFTDTNYGLAIGSNSIYIGFGDGVTYKRLLGAPTIGMGWVYVTAVFISDTDLRIYYDGVLQSGTYYDGTATSWATNNNDFYIGKAGSYYFNGLIDEVRIYNYARTADEIRLDYNAGFAAKFGPSTDCNSDPGSCMTKGLVGYWSMDEGAGQKAFDASGNGNNGTLASSTEITSADPKWGAGKSGGGLQFDGVDDYVDAGDIDAMDGASQLTITQWVKLNNLNVGDNFQSIVGKSESATHRTGIDVYSTGSVYFHASNGANSQCISNVGTVSTGVWYHITMVFDGSIAIASDRVKAYLNGIPLSAPCVAGIQSTLASNTVTFKIAKGLTESGHLTLNGSIDEVRIYNRALTPEEIRYHYNRGGPVAEWKFNEGSGQTAYDSTDNNNDGTLGASAASGADDPQWVSGKNGSGLQFDGVDDYVKIPESSTEFTFGASGFTIDYWAYTDTTTGEPDLWKIILSSGGTPQWGQFLTTYSGGAWAVRTRYRDTEFAFRTSVSFPINQWNHIALVRSGTLITTYINGLNCGSLNSNAVGNAFDDAVDSLVIGDSYYNNLNGAIDDFRIYNYARTPAQILQDYNAGFSTHFK